MNIEQRLRGFGNAGRPNAALNDILASRVLMILSSQ
jgi:hypothetical protein